MKRIAAVLCLMVAVAWLATLSLGCVAAVRVAPPPPRVEVYGAPPHPEAHWLPGYWEHRGGEWFWVPGHWERPPRPHAVWVPGHWDERPGGWVWFKGHWDYR
jgi:hypothetical protein